MKQVLKKYITALGIVLIILSSCEKYLDIDQPDIIEVEQAFPDVQSIRSSIIGLYSLIADLVEPLYLAGEVRADLVVATQLTDNYIREFSNNIISSDNPYISPKPYYKIVNNANELILQLDELLANNLYDTVTIREFKAELVGIRVWTQYQIAKIYGECYYYTDTILPFPNTTLEPMPYDTTLLGKLIDDLMFADTLVIPIEKLSWQTIRVSTYYINTLMGELYHDKGDYQNAIDKFEEVVKKGGDILAKLDDIRFKPGSILTNEGWAFIYFPDWESIGLGYEVVFMIAFDDKYNQFNLLQDWTDDIGGSYQITGADWFYDEWYDLFYTIFEFNLNFRDDENVYNDDYRFYNSFNNGGMYGYFNGEIYFRPNKTKIGKFTSFRETGSNDAPFFINRAGRIQLLLADCYNQLGVTITALRELNVIRSRAGTTKLLMPGGIEDEQIWLEDAIIDELAYETAFEGQRWFDLMRVAKRRNDPAYLADRVAKKYTGTTKLTKRNRLLDQANWYLPVNK